jgi:hypothetical protein
MVTDNWRDPIICNMKRLRAKGNTKKSMTLSAELDRKRRRVVLPGYPVKAFNMSKKQRDDYFTGDSITCLLCGKKYRALGGAHLNKVHNVTEDNYRKMYGIPYTQGLSCGDLLKIRAEQGKSKVANLSVFKDVKNRKQARLSAAAIEARKNNIKVASESFRKLSKEAISLIRKDRWAQWKIAKDYGVTQSCISYVKAQRVLD